MIKASDILTSSFDKLSRLLDANIIKAGTQDERDFLKVECTQNLYAFMVANNIVRPPQVEVIWSRSAFSDPDELRVKVDDITVQSLKQRGLW